MIGRSKDERRTRSTIDSHNLTLFAAACIFLFAILLLSRRGPEEAKWQLAQGTIQDTRVVVDNAVETKWGGQLTWKAEYKVVYFVGNREHAVWADSGIRGESEAGVRLSLPPLRPTCRVRYDPRRPEVSVADCR